jgi:hypothetical protein
MKSLINFAVLSVILGACQTTPKMSHQGQMPKQKSAKRTVASEKTDNARLAIARTYLNTAATIAQGLAIAKKENAVCEMDIYENDVIIAVTRAHSIASYSEGPLLQKMRADLAGKSQIRHAIGYTLLYKEILGLFEPANQNLEQFKKAMEGTRYYGPANGAYGSTELFDLLPAGKLVWTSLLDENAEYSKVTIEGTWALQSVSGSDHFLLSIDVKDRKGQPQKVEVMPVRHCADFGQCLWYLSRPLKGGESPTMQDMRYWNSLTSECDA